MVGLGFRIWGLKVWALGALVFMEAPIERCQKYGPLLGASHRLHILIGTPKGTMICISNHPGVYKSVEKKMESAIGWG